MTKATGPTYRVHFRRRRANLTNYAKRLALVKSGSTRMVVRKSNRGVLVQFVDYGETGDRTLLTVPSRLLSKFGWPAKGNVPTAYLTGLLAGRLAAAKKIKSAVLDAGLQAPTKSSALFAALKGAADAGLSVPHGEGLVDEARLKGEHIAAHRKLPELKQMFEKAKEAIMKS